MPCNTRSCSSCGVLWLGDTRVRVLAAAQQLPGAVALVTVTAPGQDVLPWGPCGRRVRKLEAARWNATAPARWSALHQAAARVARRRAAGASRPWALLVKTWEYQRRGVLHLHLLVPMYDSQAAAASEAYVSELAARAGAHGFGFVDRGKLPSKGARQSSRRLVPVSPHRAASYVAAYVASTGAGKEGVAEVARLQGVPGAVVYVAQALTRSSGVTMRSLRHRRRVASRFPAYVSSARDWEAACLADAVERASGRMDARSRSGIARRAAVDRWRSACIAPHGLLVEPTPACPPRSAVDAVPVTTWPPRAGWVRLDPVPHRDSSGAVCGVVGTLGAAITV